MKSWIFTYVLVSSLFSFNEFSEEKIVDSKIEEVTVYKNSAHITRRTSSVFISGNAVVKVEGISSFIDQKSIEVKIKGGGILNGVQFRRNHLLRDELQTDIKEMTVVLDSKRDSLEISDIKLEALALREDFLKSNKHIKGEDVNLELTILSDIDGYYAKNLTDILLEKRKLIIQKDKLSKSIKKIAAQIQEIRPQVSKIPFDLLVNITPKKRPGTSNDSISLQIAYQVTHAGWYSSYDLRANAIDQPIELKHKANVYQRTGEDWNNVKLSFSNENTSISKDLPKLEPMYLPPRKKKKSTAKTYRSVSSACGYVLDETGMPLVGANVLAIGTTIGVITDMDGYYSIDMPPGCDRLVISYTGYETEELLASDQLLNTVLQEGTMLDEVVVRSALPTKNINDLAATTAGVRGSRSNATYYYIDGVRVSAKSAKNHMNYEDSTPEISLNETELNFKFTLDEAFSIVSDGKNNEIALRIIDMAAAYKYRAIPKLNSNVYLTAYVDDWEDKKLLPGNMNLYFEGAYVGTSMLDPEQLKDSMQLSLGIDSKIKIERERTKLFTKKIVLKSKKQSSIAYQIEVKNLKSKKVEIEIIDQIPISTIKEIIVEEGIITPGFEINSKTGIGKWEIILDEDSSKSLAISFDLRYPKGFNFRF